jgi:hypothetical protein
MKQSPSPVLLAGHDGRRDKALVLLREAYLAALHTRREPWDFAIGLDELYAAGITGTDLRGLICEGLVAHAREKCTPGRPVRTFQRLSNLMLPPDCSFALTEQGFDLVQARARPSLPDPVPAGAHKPYWDASLRELWWRGQIVKRFRTRAASQETILLALEEESWPSRIDDPLPQMAGVDPFQRLHDAVRGLNRNQCHCLLVFQRDGTGHGVQWKARGAAIP